MLVNRITNPSNHAVQVMVDMMRYLMESVMDKASTCSDSIRRAMIDSGAIVTRVMHKGIKAYGNSCPKIKKGMWSLVSQRS